MVSLGNHSSNSKSSSNLTGSSQSSRHGDRQRENTQNSQVSTQKYLYEYNISWYFLLADVFHTTVATMYKRWEDETPK